MNLVLTRKWADNEFMRELVQDLIHTFAPMAEPRLVKVKSQYQPGLKLALPRQPEAIVLVRATSVTNPAAAMTHTGAVDFTWDGSNAVITRIDGLTPGATVYTFTFMTIYG